MHEYKIGDWVKCIRKCGSNDLQISEGDAVQIKDIRGGDRFDLTRNGKCSNGSSMEYFVKALPHEIPIEFRPKLISKQQKENLLNLIKSI
ncbi:MAG: hypothetical protein E6R13_06245 [Spirochaetes bacterium]|nr:MAG: hypothetical protein E6R13_06245 [Spirochaetota bacterium]